MKLLVSFLTALCVGYMIQQTAEGWRTMRVMPRDFATRYMRVIAEKFLARKIPWVLSYQKRIAPLIQEVGLPTGMDPSSFFAMHAVTGLPLWIMTSFAFPQAAFWTLPLCLAGGGVLPFFWLKHRQRQLHTTLLRALPDYLDLQALVMEAGLDFNAGLQRYLDKASPNPLRTWLWEAQRAMGMGRSRAETFSALLQRTSFTPLRDMCRALIQAFSLGSSLSPLLREQGAALRIKRMQIAEKKAAEAPIKVLFPLFVFIFPTIFIVLLGPMALLFMHGGF